jgi:hypothetical protein
LAKIPRRDYIASLSSYLRGPLSIAGSGPDADDRQFAAALRP